MGILVNSKMFLSTDVWNFCTSTSPSIGPQNNSFINHQKQSVIQYKFVQYLQKHNSINATIAVNFYSKIFKIHMRFCQRFFITAVIDEDKISNF